MKGDVTQLLEPQTADRLAAGHEAAIPRHIAGRDASDLRLHGGGVGMAGDGLAIVEHELVEGIDSPQIHVVGHLAPAEPPEVLEQERRRNDGRAGVEGELVLTMHISPTARRISRSSTVTRYPRAPSRIAAARPPNPLPMTTAWGAVIFLGDVDRRSLGECQHELTLEPRARRTQEAVRMLYGL